MDSQPQSKADFNLSAKLFSALRKLQGDLAEEGGDLLIPYHIFRDDTMQEISEKVPITKQELLEINGLGEGRVSKYGDRVLETIEATIKESYKGDLISNGSNDSTESIKRRRDDDFLTESTKKRVVDLNPSAKLYSALQMLRNDLIKGAGKGVMAYHIFGNTTLQLLSNKIPRTKEELLEINGLSKVKVNKYGDRILETIDKFLKGDGNDSSESIKRKNDECS